MNTIFNMEPESRVWVYQSNKMFSEEETLNIQIAGIAFIDEWTAHGEKLNASFDVLYNCFIIIAVDEQQAMASGCGIDKSVKFIQELEKKFSLNLFDRFQVAYRRGSSIEICELSTFERIAKQGDINESTIVFNNTIVTKYAFDNLWEVPLKESWQNRVLKNTDL